MFVFSHLRRLILKSIRCNPLVGPNLFLNKLSYLEGASCFGGVKSVVFRVYKG